VIHVALLPTVEFGISTEIAQLINVSKLTYSTVPVGRCSFPVKVVWKKEMLYDHCFSDLLFVRYRYGNSEAKKNVFNLRHSAFSI